MPNDYCYCSRSAVFLIACFKSKDSRLYDRARCTEIFLGQKEITLSHHSTPVLLTFAVGPDVDPCGGDTVVLTRACLT